MVVMKRISTEFFLILSSALLLFDCNKTSDLETIPHEDTPKKNEVFKHNTDNNCLVLAESLIDNFDAKQYVLIDPLEANHKNRTLVSFNWSVCSTDKEEEQRVNCSFRKKN